ncbi:MAG: hypothetical protein HRU20_17670 [Pseudomonadales bacterium]|nr:hypothetical protein [Pseudomonadales bacterium]
MIKVHATKKLLAKLPVDEDGYLPSKDDYPAAEDGTLYSTQSLLSGWHANLITLQRRMCVLFVHDKTRLAVFIPLLKKPDFAMLDRHFQDVLMNVLLKMGIDTDVLENTASELQPLCFDSSTDRSVLGTMTMMKQTLEHRLHVDGSSVDDLLPYSTSVWLSDRPYNVKGCKNGVFPLRDMPDFLKVGELKSPLLAQVERHRNDNVIQFSDYQKRQS